MRKAVALLASLVLPLVLTGCGTSSAGRSGAVSGSEQLTIAWWGSQGRNEKQREVDELFERKNPGVTIQGQFSQYGDYWQKLATTAAGRSMPDIVAMDLPYLNQYTSNHLLRDLDPYFKDGTIDTAHISRRIIDTGRGDDGQVYALSSGINAPAVIYDKTLLDSLGITIDPDWTLDDFIDICRRVYRRTGVKTNAGYYRDANMLEYQLRAEGISLYKGQRLGVSDPAKVEPYFDLFQKGIDEGWHLAPELFTEFNLSVMNQDPLVTYSDAAHRSWCNFGWSNSLGGLQSLVHNGDDLALAPWPSPDVRKSNYVHPAQYFAITRDCKDPRLAARWIDFYVNNRQANIVMGVDRGMPVNATMVAAIDKDLSADDKESIRYITDVVEPDSSTINKPAPAKAVKINAAIMPTIQEEVLYRRLDAAQAARAFLEQAAQTLNQ